MLEDLKNFEVPKTVGETLYEHLKEAIITGQLAAGQRLQEREIARKFNVSATPVREAFRRLSAENFLTINLRREIMVVEIDEKKAKEMFLVFSHLDLLASRLAVEKIREKNIQRLEALTEKLKGFYQEGKIEEYMKMDLHIHRQIWELSGNSFLTQTLLDLSEKYAFYCNNIISQSDDPASYLLVEDHQNLISAILQRDSEKLETILKSHWGKNLFE